MYKNYFTNDIQVITQGWNCILMGGGGESVIKFCGQINKINTIDSFLAALTWIEI